ncbi:Crp/Fnr family transcriptional regulator [Sulfitobacter marinus]|nr:Crp/Fnr family transcriptional regulator [Sulfitobacter marinus]
MAELATEKRLEKGEVLFEQGDPGETLYAIGSGTLEFSVLSPDGRKLILDVMNKGAIFGEIALFSPGPRTATVIALEAATVWGVKNTDVLASLRERPELGVDMIQLAGRRMRWMGQQLRDQVFLPLTMRLAQKILYLAMHNGTHDNVLKLSQAELAEFVGVSRESVSKTLAIWKREGVIDLSRGSLRILEKENLEKIAASEII